MAGVLVHLLTFDTIPQLDQHGRPKAFYSRRVHDPCYRRPYYDAGMFVESFDDDHARLSPDFATGTALSPHPFNLRHERRRRAWTAGSNRGAPTATWKASTIVVGSDRHKVYELNARRVYPRLDAALKQKGL